MAEGTVAADQLRLFIERIERLNEEIKELGSDVKDVYAEAKANGYDPKIMRMCVKLRKMETHQREEQDAVLETYRAALGLDLPYSQRAPLAKDKTPLESVIDKVCEQVNNGALDREGCTVRAEVVTPQVVNAKPTFDPELYQRAVAAVNGKDSIFASTLAHDLNVTGDGAMRLLQRMEQDGLVGPPDALNRRPVLMQQVAH